MFKKMVNWRVLVEQLRKSSLVDTWAVENLKQVLLLKTIMPRLGHDAVITNISAPLGVKEVYNCHLGVLKMVKTTLFGIGD